MDNLQELELLDKAMQVVLARRLGIAVVAVVALEALVLLVLAVITEAKVV
jgi:hypothetical protein